MEEHVEVIPGDGVISVNGIPMQFKFPPVAGHEKVHAIQWHYGSGTLELDGFTGESLTADDYDRAVAPYVQFWNTEKTRREKEKAEQEAEYNRIENVKARKLAELNRAMEEAKASSSVSIKSSVGYGQREHNRETKCRRPDYGYDRHRQGYSQFHDFR